MINTQTFLKDASEYYGLQPTTKADKDFYTTMAAHDAKGHAASLERARQYVQIDAMNPKIKNIADKHLQLVERNAQYAKQVAEFSFGGRAWNRYVLTTSIVGGVSLACSPAKAAALGFICSIISFGLIDILRSVRARAELLMKQNTMAKEDIAVIKSFAFPENPVSV